MKKLRLFPALVLALTSLASCIGSQSCIDIAGCEINIGSLGAAETSRDGAPFFDDAIDQLIRHHR